MNSFLPQWEKDQDLAPIILLTLSPATPHHMSYCEITSKYDFQVLSDPNVLPLNFLPGEHSLGP
jgi:hypothetical protein